MVPRVFQTIYTFGSNVEEFLHLIIPVTMKTAERSDIPLQMRIFAVNTINGLARKVNFSDHASRIIHPLARMIPTANQELRLVIMDALCVLLIQLGSDYAIFVPMMNKVSGIMSAPSSI